MMAKVFLMAIITVFALAGCGMPRDPEKTLDRITGGVLRVGVVHHPPWANVPASKEVGGVEARLVERLAAQLNAKIHWVPGAEKQLLEGLGRRELDLVIGGFDEKTPWEKKVGMTRPYYTTKIVTGTHSPSGPPPSIAYREVVVAEDAPDLALLAKDEKAIPRVVSDLRHTSSAMPLLTEEWRLKAWNYTPGEKLHEEKQVILTPQGENRWILTVDRFLDQQGETVEQLLKEEVVKDAANEAVNQGAKK